MGVGVEGEEKDLDSQEVWDIRDSEDARVLAMAVSMVRLFQPTIFAGKE